MHVLLVEDNPGDARLFFEMFQENGAEAWKIAHVVALSPALEHLKELPTDIVLLDLGLPDAQGLEALLAVRTTAPSVPVVVLTSWGDRETSLSALKQGAQDYLEKGPIEADSLNRSLRYAIERHKFLAETDLAQRRQLQLKDEFLSHVSHELRSPLAAIYQFTTILADGLAGECSPSQRAYLDIILRNARQLESMIEDLLDVTRAETGKLTIEPQRMRVDEVAREAMESARTMAPEKRLVFQLECEDRILPAYADPVRIRQVLLNLLGNAIKFTPEAGNITVGLKRSPESSAKLLVSVSDTGCGIAPESAPKIFERLYQCEEAPEASRRGLGLGLYICKELIQRQGGKIWVESKLHEGSTFSFTVPVFSIAELLAPIFSQERRCSSVALMCVSLSSRDGWSGSETKSQAARAGISVLRRCLLPDMDVLLPKMDSSVDVERFFIVAATGCDGAEVLAKRIRGQIDRSFELSDSTLSWEISSDIFEISPEIRDLSGKAFCDSLEDLLIQKLEPYSQEHQVHG